MKRAAPRRLSLELILVIAIPLLTVLAGILTIAVAVDRGFTEQQQVHLDRFARPLADAEPEETQP